MGLDFLGQVENITKDGNKVFHWVSMDMYLVGTVETGGTLDIMDMDDTGLMEETEATLSKLQGFTLDSSMDSQLNLSRLHLSVDMNLDLI